MHRRRIVILCGCLAALWSLGSCAPPATEGGFDAENPAAKLYAIQRAGLREDRSKIPQLIEQLDSDDPAVRLFAIEALERITDETHGYRAYDPPHRRAEAIDRWVDAYRGGEQSGGRDVAGAGPDTSDRTADGSEGLRGSDVAETEDTATP